ncbi:uncharacterized protein B0H18DRAFT_1017146 [Fomitopsis serialis]|uniref:uncharacterized protein n=1 Tax=Fomitopsis serialis TaxID=139415 RepID=UPI0020076994|nr:uncharacterized protein B0H18DRAFT_1017146 [Neoantrodia serialis]KAH9922628.1 hypothetical protein B0H18DRAFT_1017146 [Neoantrodia serialis]
MCSILTVCRSWRQSVYNCPEFWTTIQVCKKTTSRGLWGLIARSNSLPINLALSGSDHLVRYLDARHDSPGPPIRIRNLQLFVRPPSGCNDSPRAPCVCGDVQDTQLLQRPFFHQPAPLLEGLQLFVGGPSISSQPLPRLFKGSAPRLSRLVCIGLSPHINNRFASLTHLYLYEGTAAFGDTPDSELPHDAPFLASFLDFLEGSQNLEELVLVHDSCRRRGCRRCRDEPPALAGRRVHLPRLQRITFDEEAWLGAGRLLRYVVPARRATVQSDCSKIRSVIGNGHSMYDFLPVLTRDAGFLAHLSGITKVALWLTKNQHCLMCSGPDCALTLNLVHGLIPLEMHVVQTHFLTVARAFPTEFVRAVVRALDLRGVVDLSVQIGGVSLLVADARDLFAAMPKVRTCTVGFDARVHRSFWSRCLSKADAPFPELKTLHFVGDLPAGWKPWEVLGLVIRRAMRGRRLEGVKFTAVASDDSEPEFVKWNADVLRVGGRRVLDYVGSLEFGRVGVSPMDAPEVDSWDGSLL